MEPVLRDQELAPPFDIHQYSDKILLQFDELSIQRSQQQRLQANSEDLLSNPLKQFSNANIVQFEEAVMGKPREEVCRAFLACLQLANLGNILVVPPGQETTFGVQVITTAKKQDVENYFAH